MTLSSTPQFSFATNYEVCVIKSQKVFSIRENDWQRIKTHISNIIPKTSIFEICASVLYGIFGSSILSLLAFYNSKSIEPWIFIVNWAILICSLLLGIAMSILDSQQKRIIKTSVQYVLDEMNDIENELEQPDNCTGDEK
jgi:hypothetical protein